MKNVDENGLKSSINFLSDINKFKFIWEGTTKKLRCLLLDTTNSNISKHLNLSLSIFPGPLDDQTNRPKGL